MGTAPERRGRVRRERDPETGSGARNVCETWERGPPEDRVSVFMREGFRPLKKNSRQWEFRGGGKQVTYKTS